MTLIRLFYKNDLSVGKNIILDNKNNINYIVNVMRRKVGDKLIFVNGKDGEFIGVIDGITKNNIIVKIVEKTKDFEKPNFLGLIFSPIQKIDLLVKNATEMGVTDFCPFKSQYSQYVKKIGKIEPNIVEAIEQCERLDFPIIHKEKSLKEVLDEINDNDSVIIFCEERSHNKLLNTIQNIDKNKKIYALIGGEGGFSEEEKQLIKSYKNVYSVSLGNRILRAETATTCILSIIQGVFYES